MQHWKAGRRLGTRLPEHSNSKELRSYGRTGRVARLAKQQQKHPIAFWIGCRASVVSLPVRKECLAAEQSAVVLWQFSRGKSDILQHFPTLICGGSFHVLDIWSVGIRWYLYHLHSGYMAFIDLSPQACALMLRCNKCHTSFAPVYYIQLFHIELHICPCKLVN